MDDAPGVPETIVAAGDLIKVLTQKVIITRADREAINRAKLKIAFWACSVERLPASRDNLVHVLGPDAKEIMENYDRYLTREDAKETGDAGSGGKRSRKPDADFWNGA